MSPLRTYGVGDEPVPGYRLVRFLGRGGFGEVWEALAPGGTHVALKIINLGTKQGLKELRAIKLVKQVQHANLVPINAFWLKDGSGDFLDEDSIDQAGNRPSDGKTAIVDRAALSSKFRATELILVMGLGHMNLLQRLEECQEQGLTGIPAEELLGYLHDAARAIDYLNSSRHNLGSGPVAIQHCDIKPQNILIVGNAAQVCDFGLARVLNDARATSAAGSVAYMAPECIESNTPSPSTDQYSLAVSFVELRTGSLPFPEDAGAATMIHSHLASQLELSKLSAAECAVVRRACSRQPTDRYPSATQLVQALREAIEGKSPTRPALRPWRFVMAMSGILLLAVLGAWGAKALMLDERSFDLLASNDVTVRAGMEVPIAIHVERHRFAEEVRPSFSGLPAGVRIEVAPIDPNRDDVQARVIASLDARPGTTRITLLGKARSMQRKRSIELTIEAANPPWVPEGFTADVGSGQVQVNGKNCSRRIICTRHGLAVPCVLVPESSPDDPESFYMMEQKVSNELFSRFAQEMPDAVKNSDWQSGGLKAGKNVSVTNGRLPVLRVTFDEAWKFAVWMGGRLPTMAQWDKAAGRFESKRGEGPFRPGAGRIAVGRAQEGPAEVGASPGDVSPFGCHDMAGNGREFTRSSTDASIVLPLKKRDEVVTVILRGRNYAQPNPLTYAEMEDPNAGEAQLYFEADPFTGFRVIFDNLLQ